jgi:regulator of sigma D
MKEIISLKSRLTFILIILSLVPMICISLVFKNKIKHLQKDSLSESFQQELKGIEHYLAEQDNIIANQVSNLVKEPVMQEVMANDASGQIKQFIEKLKTENSIFKEIVVISDKLEVIATTNQFYNGYLLEKGLLEENITTKIKKDKVNISKQSILRLSMPILATYNQETCVGYLTVFLNEDAITELVAKFSSTPAEKNHLIFALVDQASQSLLYSNSNLVNNFNLNLLGSVKLLSNIKLANNDFIFNKYHISTELLFDTTIYLGKLASLAYENNGEFGKLFEQTIPLIIIAQLVLIIIAVKLFVFWIDNTHQSIKSGLVKKNEVSELNHINQDRNDLTQLIERIMSFTDSANEKAADHDSYQHLKRDIQQISLSLFNIRLELAKSQIHNPSVNSILEQTISKVKQLQEFVLNNDNLITNSEKTKLNSLLHKLSSEVKTLLRTEIENAGS